MHTRPWFAKSLAVACAALAFGASTASAQAWHYPTLQTPDISIRDYTVLVAGGGDYYGTSVVGQWREGINPDAMFNVDVGLATPGSTTLFLIGAGVGYSVLKATPETPIDIIATGGFYGAFGNGSELRIPIGVVAGHRFPISGSSNPLAVTPFVSPRLSVDICASDCGSGDTSVGTDLKVNFDIGAALDITRSFGLRAALTVGGVGPGSSKTSFGIGATYRPNMAPRH